MAQLARSCESQGECRSSYRPCGSAGPTPPLTGPVGKALRAAQALELVPQGYWWQWAVHGQYDPLDMVVQDWDILRHRIRDNLRRASLLQLEALHPQHGGGDPSVLDANYPPN